MSRCQHRALPDFEHQEQPRRCGTRATEATQLTTTTQIPGQAQPRREKTSNNDDEGTKPYALQLRLTLDRFGAAKEAQDGCQILWCCCNIGNVLGTH